MLADFFGNLERLAADLYPYRLPIEVVILIVIAAVAYYAYRRGLHLWAWQRRLRVAIIGIPVLVLLGIVGWDLGSPLFINVTVEEEFPFAYAAEVPADMTMEEIEMVMSTVSKMDMPPVAEPMPEMLGAASTFQGTFTPASQLTPTAVPPAAATPEPTAQPDAAAAPSPTKLKSGEFRDADSFHKGSGQALIFDLPGANKLLRLENFRVTNGPELHVILTQHPDPDRHSDLEEAGFVDLGLLKGNVGNQNYEIPEDVNVADQQSVVIYCYPFRVVFSVATLADAN